MFGTGKQMWPLKSGSNDQPVLALGRPTAFQMNDVPDRCPTGPLAYYVPFLLLTILGAVTQASEGSVAIPRDMFPALLIDSVDWTNAWHGSPLNGEHVKGAHLPIIEFEAGGFRNGQRQANQIPATGGTYPFSITVALPASDRRSRLVRETSQLALLYQPSQVKINMNQATVLDGYSDGATWGTLNGRISAALDPRSELVLGCGVEWILHQVPGGTNSSAVKINGFGRDTMFTGVEGKGGVMFLGELTSVGLQGGVFEAENVTQFSFPWRGQTQTQDVVGWVNAFLDQVPSDRAQISVGTPVNTTSRTNDFAGEPFLDDKLDGGADVDLVGRRYWPWVQIGDKGRLSELQTANRDESYYLTVTGGFAEGDHMILGEYARRFSDAKRADWVSKVTSGDDPLMKYVFQGRPFANVFAQRAPEGHTLTDDQKTYLAWQLT